MGVPDPLGLIGATLKSKQRHTYRVDAFAGEGGFAVVYSGTDEARRRVALKVLRRGVEGRRAFFDEARILIGLRRIEGIVRVLDFGEAPLPAAAPTPFFVTEWIDGRTLATELARRPRRTVAEALALLTPAIETLAIAHDQGIAHRDLKPENLMLCGAGSRATIKVLDFGIAKAMGGAESVGAATTASADSRAFSRAYAAPEQFNPALGATGPWTDVHALGLILIEAVDGSRAYSSDSYEGCRAQALDLEQRPSLADDRSLDAVLRRALAVDPRNRYSTAGELLEALRSPSPRPAPSTTAPEPPPARPPRGKPTAVPEAPATPTTPWLGPRTAARAWVALSAIGALVLGVAAWKGQDWAPPPSPSAVTVSASAPVAVPAPTQAAAAIVTVPVDAGPKTAAFRMQRHEVTVEEYVACVTTRGCASTKTNYGVDPFPMECNEHDPEAFARHPINCVSYAQAKLYCERLGGDGERGRLPTADEWRRAAGSRSYMKLPKACEWAVFARPRGRSYPAGCKDTSGTEPVDAKRSADPFGTQDLRGNVHEWGTDPAGHPVLLGGGWDSAPEFLSKDLPTFHAAFGLATGFRCVLRE